MPSAVRRSRLTTVRRGSHLGLGPAHALRKLSNWMKEPNL